jgi:hypothetical protein
MDMSLGRRVRVAHGDQTGPPRSVGTSRILELKPEVRLLLPSTLLVTIRAQLLAPLVFIDFCFPTFFQ